MRPRPKLPPRAAAKKDGVEHLIHKKDGTIGGRNSYGNDSHPPKGQEQPAAAVTGDSVTGRVLHRSA